MLVRQSLLLLITLLCGLVLAEQTQDFEQSILISKYYHNVESQFFVVIGVQQNFTSAINSQLRSWSGINIIEKEDETINNLIHRSKDQTLHFAISNSSPSDPDKSTGQSAPTISLKQLCHSYYLVRPSLMILSDPKNLYNTLSTNEWGNQLCSPQMILMPKNRNQSDTDLEKYLLNNNYQQVFATLRFIAYVNHNQLSVADNRAIQYAKNGANIQSFNQERDVIAIYRTLFPSVPLSHEQIHNPSKIYIEQMTDDLLVIPNIVKQLTLLGEKRPIFVLNFRIEEDVVLFGTQVFSIVQFKAEHMTFKNITLSFNNAVYNVYVWVNNNKGSWLKLIDENGEIVFERASGKVKNSDILKECVDVQEKVTVKIRENIYPYHPLKATIRQEIKYPKSQKKVPANEPKVQAKESQRQENKLPPPPPVQIKQLQKESKQIQNKNQQTQLKAEGPKIFPQQSDKSSASQTAEMSQWIILFWMIIASVAIISLILLIKNKVRSKTQARAQNFTKAFSYFSNKIQTFEMEEIQQSDIPDQTVVQTEQTIT